MYNYRDEPGTATDAFYQILFTISEIGIEQEVRGLKTKEVFNNSAIFDMRYPFIVHRLRNVNWKFLGAEIEAICNGDNRVENLSAYNKRMAQFSDDGLILNGSYGPPFNHQLMYVVDRLVEDPTSRQAVISIWKPNPVKSKDIRCTLTLQFMLRNGKIFTFVNMRSSDAIWGVTYDFPVFTFMTLRVLTLLNARHGGAPYLLGNLHWNAASSHYYDRHYNEIRAILSSNPPDNSAVPPLLDHYAWNWDDCIQMYRDLQNGLRPLQTVVP